MNRLPLAITGLACRYPDAASPAELWRNLMDGRISFREMPARRLDLAAYGPGRVDPADTITDVAFGLIDNWRFDRTRFKIAPDVFEQTDVAHWLALDLAAEALDASGGLAAINRSRTAVVVANTLTGEASRTALLRFRAPFLESILRVALQEQDCAATEVDAVLRTFRERLADALPAATADTLAGSLANTIAGRIANYFDLHGGAFSVDAACASSHIALAQAADLVASGRCDVVLVGAVDVSLDPFELIGFSRCSALSPERMRVFDRRSAGFWPCEGGAFAVLVSAERAAALHRPALAYLCGYGISSDGAGGLTRPSAAGQRLAIERALVAAGLSPDAIHYVEAHGTGTAVGDPIEVEALDAVFRSRRARLPIGSVKANIGHAKAAAGFAGFAKLVASFGAGWIPPHAGCEIAGAGLRDAAAVEVATVPVRVEPGAAAGLSGFGFGGVNGHLVLRPAAHVRRPFAITATPVRFQAQELFCVSARSPELLRAALLDLRTASATASISDLADLAAREGLADHAQRPARAALIAARPTQLAARIDAALRSIDRGMAIPAEGPGVFVGLSASPPRVGLLFPGQGAPVRTADNAWMARFPGDLGELAADLPAAPNVDTAVAQPAIVAAALAGTTILARAGVEAEVVVGHSLGELNALAWTGVLSPLQCRTLARIRGSAMAQHAIAGGAMARLEASAQVVASIAADLLLDVACDNAPDECVVSGPAAAVEAFVAAVGRIGIRATPLAVSHAFHSELIAPAQLPFRRELQLFSLNPPERAMISTITGAPLTRVTDVVDMLTEQLVAPVRFHEAIVAASAICDVFVEVGPGKGLCRLAERCGARALSLDALANNLDGLMASLGELFVMGACPDLAIFFADRAIRPPAVPSVDAFLTSRCGRQDGDGALPKCASPPAVATAVAAAATASPVFVTVRERIAQEMALDVAEIAADARLSADLHLNSLAVGRLVSDLAATLGLAPAQSPTDLGALTVAELAEHLTEHTTLGGPATGAARIEGAGFWVRTFTRAFVPIDITALVRPDPGPRWTPIDDPAEGADGALMLAPRDLRYESARALWAAARSAHRRGLRHLAILHEGLQLEGFAASLLMDSAFDTVRLVDVPCVRAQSDTVARILGGAIAEPLVSLRVDSDCALHALQLLPVNVPREVPAHPLGPSDHILVTGGGTGIGAECALHLAERTGARLLLVGRRAGSDPEVQATLRRARERGIGASYATVDISTCHRATVRLAECELKFGKITAVIHAAGVNRPGRFDDLGDDELAQTFLPKLEGLETILAAIDHANVKFLATFGSVIAHTGLAGEAHYALANAYVGMRLEEWAAEPAHQRLPPRYLALDWSLWAGGGMGERLGVIERLRARGVDPLPLGEALGAFEALCCDSAASGRFLVTSRFRAEAMGTVGTVPAAPLRFIERILVQTPGVELVAECTLSLGSDPYLADHALAGRPLMPGVMLLEAIAQTATRLVGERRQWLFRDVVFAAAVWCSPGAAVTLRIAALAEGDGRIRLDVRASSDNFASVVARATLDPSVSVDLADLPCAGAPDDPPCTADGLLFSAGRMRSVRAFDHLDAFAVDARLASRPDERWFGAFCPQETVLGDPAARDGALQALIPTVPQFLVLPSEVDAVIIDDPLGPRHAMRARQVWANGTRFCFDIWWLADDGRVVEYWRRAVFVRAEARTAWPDEPQLAAVYLERELQLRGAGCGYRVVLVEGGETASRRAAGLARLGLTARGSRGDGAPLIAEACIHSRAHAGAWTVLAAGERPIHVDIVPTDAVPALDPTDNAVLEGEPSLLARQAMWAAREALRKAGHPPGSTLCIERIDDRTGAIRVRDDLFLFVRSAAGVIGALVPNPDTVSPLHGTAPLESGGR